MRACFFLTFCPLFFFLDNRLYFGRLRKCPRRDLRPHNCPLQGTYIHTVKVVRGPFHLHFSPFSTYSTYSTFSTFSTFSTYPTLSSNSTSIQSPFPSSFLILSFHSSLLFINKLCDKMRRVIRDEYLPLNLSFSVTCMRVKAGSMK